MPTKGVTLVHVNICSIYRKIHQLNLLYNSVDFLFCSETWLDNRFQDNMVNLDNMKIFRNDRKHTAIDYHIRNKGGGVCIYVGKMFKDHANIFKPATVTNKNFEILTILINKPKLKKLALICVYKPPKGNAQTFIDFLKDILRTKEFENREVWILGDWNINWLKRDDPDTVKLISFCKILKISN